MKSLWGILARGRTTMESLLFLAVIILAAVLLVQDKNAHGVLGVLRVIVLFLWKLIVGFWGLVKRISPQ